jgi:hypothetical protein
MPLALALLLALAASPPDAPPSPLLERTCPPAIPLCAGLRIHIAAPDSAELTTWLASQLDEANRLFAVADIGFVPLAVTRLSTELTAITTRDQRDDLGHDRFAPNVIDVYIVTHLADVDIPGAEIRGVHWRSRGDRTRRFIILSTISPPKVLAHELGHYFGLPHSNYAESIMNKAPRATPPPEERRFATAEVRRIVRRSKELFRPRALDNRATPPTDVPSAVPPR